MVLSPLDRLEAQSGITILDATVSEAGASGFGQIIFRVRVSRDTSVAAGQVSVQFQGASGTATVVGTQCGPGVDIVIQASTVTIPANSNEGQISGTVCEDPLDEADAETFTVNLMSPFGASIQDGQATGTLMDDDPTPSLRVADVMAPEGNPGEQRNLTFTLTLSAASGRAVSVDYAVGSGGAGTPAAQGGAACGGAVDYVTRTGTETFPPGATSRQVAVTLCGDALFEPNERLAMSLSGATHSTLADGTGVGTIDDDDPQPEVRLVLPNDGNLTEGSSGPQTVSVQVTLSTPNHAGASVTFARGGTAVRGATCTGAVDMVATTNQVTVSWPANNNAPQTIDLTICGDTRDDDNDTIELNLTAAVAAAVAAGNQANRMVIFDDDPTPTLSVVDATVTEGGQAEVTVTLSAASNRAVDVLLGSAEATAAIAKSLPGRVSVALATVGSACGGDVDFIKTAHRLQVPAGELTATTPLRITTCRNGDATGTNRLAAGPDAEVFQVAASSPTNATIARAVGMVVIREP
jgi:hypothetical protein